MPFLPENARPEFIRHVTERREQLRIELRALAGAQTQPLVLEIGCGHGHFLAAYAQANPARFSIGIDIIGERLVRARRKQSAAGLANVAFVKAEALEFLECWPEGFFFADVFVLFPDPWPKKRHHKNRLICGSFLDRLASKMAPSARLYFRTDHLGYAEWARGVLQESQMWQLLEQPELWPFEKPTVFQQRAEAGFRSLIAEVRGR